MTKKETTLETKVDTDTETKPTKMDQYKADNTPTILFAFEDFTIFRKPKVTHEGNEVSSEWITIIDKRSGGISDSCYSRVATGQDKNWNLLNQNGRLIDTGSIHGNKPFHWEGLLEPNNVYMLMTGKSNNTSIHRIPGRSFKIVFAV